MTQPHGCMSRSRSSGTLPPAPTIDCCEPTGLRGWSPPDLPADTPWKRRVDRLLPRTGLAALVYFGGVVVLLNVGRLLPPRWDLLTVTLATLAAGGWCAVNFWRCRHAHCLVTGIGWLALGVVTLAETGVGHSLVGGDERIAFVAVLVAGLVLECTWRTARGSNAMTAAAPAGTTADKPHRSDPDERRSPSSGPS